MGEVSYKGHRYPAEIIAHCVWLYHRFPLSFREVEELMVVRGVIVTPLGADLLRPGHRHPQPGLRQRRPRQIQPGPRGHRVLRPLESRLRQRPPHADHGSEGHHPHRAGELDARGVTFLTLRMRSPALVNHIDTLTGADYTTITLDRPGRFNKPKVHEDTGIRLTGYPGTVRQLVVTGLGRNAPTVIITNDYDLSIKALIEHYARRMTIEQRLAEIIQAFHADALSSAVNLNADLDIMLCVLAQALTAALRARLPGYASVTPDVLQCRFLETPARSPLAATPSPSASTAAPTPPCSAKPTSPTTPQSPGGETEPYASNSADMLCRTRVEIRVSVKPDGLSRR